MIPVFMISSFNISPQNNAFSQGITFTFVFPASNLAFNPCARLLAIFGKLSAKTAVVTRPASTIASVTSSGCVIGDNADTWSISFR